MKGVQCGNVRLQGSDVCYVHKKKCERGKVRGLIPKYWLTKYQEKEQRLAASEQKCKQWYSRHLMWYYAKKRVPELQSLTQKDPEGRFVLNDATYAECLDEINA